MAYNDLQKTIPVLERSLAFFRPHHLELRNRLVRVLSAIFCCSAIAYMFAEKIALFLVSPLFSSSPSLYRLVYTNLPEAFLVYIKLSVLVGIIGSLPITLYQIWLFVAPGLLKNEKKKAIWVVSWAMLLFGAGGCFAFLVVLPKILVYFMGYAHSNLEPLPKFDLYLAFVARMILTFGIAFQIPFLMVMAIKANFLPLMYFKKNKKFFYLAIFILSFLLTTGDAVACLLLSIPLFLLYESGILLAKLFSRNK